MASTAWILELLYSSRYLIASSFVFYFFAQQYLSYRRLSHIKGPWLAAWSNLWLAGAIWRQRSHLEVYEVSKKYGSLARIGLNDLLTTDIELLHRMQAARSPYTRSDWYRGFRLAPGVDNVLSMTDDKLHAKRRAQMNMGFSGKENIALESTIDHHITSFISLIRQKYISSLSALRPMDLARKAQYFTLDVIVDIATGAPFGDLIYDEDRYEYLQSTANSLPTIATVSSVPWVGRLLQNPWIGKLVSPSATEEKGIGKVIGVATEMVAKRFSPGSKKTSEKLDMLQSFINHGITREEAVFESIITILGGSDTMAIAIRATMLFIITNPHVYGKLQAEIDDAVKTGAISDPVIKDSEARELPYLQAVIREGLRIFPPGTGQMPKLSPPEGDIVNGIFIPGGVNVGTNPWAIMRSSENFGQDSEVFRPERWLEASLEKRKEMDYVFELIWAYGKYKCLGQSIAIMELNKIFFELLRNFDWTLIDPTNPWQSSNVGIWIQKGLNVRVTDRLVEG